MESNTAQTCNIVNPIALACLAGGGAVTKTSVFGRGLVRVIRLTDRISSGGARWKKENSERFYYELHWQTNGKDRPNEPLGKALFVGECRFPLRRAERRRPGIHKSAVSCLKSAGPPDSAPDCPPSRLEPGWRFR